MSLIKIALVDDHKLFRMGIRALLEDDPKLEVLYDVGSAEAFFEKLAEAVRPDLVLMDLEMPGMDGIEATEKLKAAYPDIRVIALTMHENDQFIARLMEVGASAYLLKSMDVEDVEQAIYGVMENGFYFSDRVSRAMLGALVRKDKLRPTFKTVESLTEREVEVLRLVCEELSSEEIADRIHLSPRTVEGYRRNLLSKTGAKNLAGLVVYAIKHEHYQFD